LLSIRNVHPTYRILEIIRWFGSSIPSGKITLWIRVSPYSDPSYLEACRIAAKEYPHILFNDDPIDYFGMHEIYQVADIGLHYPISDAKPVSMLEGIACGNLIFCDPGLDAYKNLGQRYRLHLAHLSSLSEQTLIQSLCDKAEEEQFNREMLTQYDDQQININILGKLMDKSGCLS
jgi:hypothetical protein